ncbi:hypothetical protein SAMN06272735_5623 [Streptomyces sp. TLI_55]|uniref:hypothetical protein n=1 Tax=Streptomyces sp. TLI_55 TaxID=1938861 RepID=UPI000BCCD970|nr:hypothetical protein [Streptomyces sp. TLI_55]SNX63811.1 hypothetical protein SAMN06272735_5623 [Streptomyces sp. TLI_55]
MYMRRRTWVAGAALVALAAGLTACSDSDTRAGSCTDGKYTWSGVERTQKVTKLAAPITIARPTASYKAPLEVIDTVVYSRAVTPVPPGAGRSGVLAALDEHLDVDESKAGAMVDTRHGGTYVEGTALHKGAYYAWSYVDLVDADFTYTCEDVDPVKGHVRTWDEIGSDLRSCAETAPSDSGREAAARRCPTGSKAAREA